MRIKLKKYLTTLVPRQQYTSRTVGSYKDSVQYNNDVEVYEEFENALLYCIQGVSFQISEMAAISGFNLRNTDITGSAIVLKLLCNYTAHKITPLYKC